MKLYTYFRSSAAYRVRIALALKGLSWEPAYVHMLRNGGEHRDPAYRATHPQALIPAMEDGDLHLVQSIAICEYLEEKYPEPALMPSDLGARAHVRAVMSAIACEIHPLNNLRVLGYVTKTLGHSEEDKLAWYRHWIADGFAGVERLLTQSGRVGAFCCGDKPTLADAFLVPQVYNARRFECPLDTFPTIARINDACVALPQFQAARPEAQGDAA